MGYKVAVVGATGNVGREILSILAERNFPADSVVALASSRSKGKEVSYGEDKTLTCEVLDDFDFTGTDLVVQHVERYWCPSFTSNDLVGGKPFKFVEDKR